MKDHRAIMAGAAVLGCLALASCGGSDGNRASPPAASNPPNPTKQVDTTDLLTIVKTDTSETSQPFVVNGGAIVVTPVNDEIGEPMVVDGT